MKIADWMKTVLKYGRRFVQIEARLSALEKRLDDEWPAQYCRACGKRAARLLPDELPPNDKGLVRERWRCEMCGEFDTRWRKP